MTTITSNGLHHVVRTAWVNDPAHAIGEGDRVFLEVGGRWVFGGFLIAPVEVGQPLRYVTDDTVSVTGPVVSIRGGRTSRRAV